MTMSIFIVGWFAIGAFGLLVFGLSQSGVIRNPIAAITAPNKSDFRRAADRIAEIYGEGFLQKGISGEAGVQAARYGRVEISEDDYILMGCANSSARRNFPDIARDAREEPRWFAGARDLKPRFLNFEGTIEKNGTERVDSFMTSLPRQRYRASPEEVAWHYIRVKALRGQGVPEPQRIETMASEAKDKPWLTMQ